MLHVTFTETRLLRPGNMHKRHQFWWQWLQVFFCCRYCCIYSNSSWSVEDRDWIDWILFAFSILLFIFNGRSRCLTKRPAVLKSQLTTNTWIYCCIGSFSLIVFFFCCIFCSHCQMGHLAWHIMCISHSINRLTYSPANCHNKCWKKKKFQGHKNSTPFASLRSISIHWHFNQT